MRISCLIFLIIIFPIILTAKNNVSPPIINVDARQKIDLNGSWNIIIDPYENGYYDYRFQPNVEGYIQNLKAVKPTDRIEYSFDSDQILQVPGDWNSQMKQLWWYEGTIWYKKSFQYHQQDDWRLFLYFGAVNYQAVVSINGEFVAKHEGGFTPFNIEVTDKVKEGENFVIVKVDNKRRREAVPTVNTDWFNYGGITRYVYLVQAPKTFIRDYFIQLKKSSLNRVAGWVQLDGRKAKQTVTIKINEAGIEKQVETDGDGYVEFSFDADLSLWSPDNPKLYDVEISSETDRITDQIGFRSIETRGEEILLNKKPVYLRGICIHEEAPFKGGARAYAGEQAATLLGWAKDLNCNFVRLAHYPHNEAMNLMADKMGILVWSEIPVYWTIQWENEQTYQNAQNQLTEMITRDKNRAAVILWSMANETPIIDPRLEFLTRLVNRARQLDPTRLITAALEKHYKDPQTLVIEDPMSEYLDVVGCNEYVGWYDGLPDKCDSLSWESDIGKPVIISEVGGGALFGYRGDKLQRWTEDFQAYLFEKSLPMLEKPKFIRGMTPWILKDFRSPRRPLPRIQDFWNRKGLISDEGMKKQAFEVVRKFYIKKEREE